eukprot:s475_g27.t1
MLIGAICCATCATWHHIAAVGFTRSHSVSFLAGRSGEWRKSRRQWCRAHVEHGHCKGSTCLMWAAGPRNKAFCKERQVTRDRMVNLQMRETMRGTTAKMVGGKKMDTTTLEATMLHTTKSGMERGELTTSLRSTCTPWSLCLMRILRPSIVWSARLSTFNEFVMARWVGGLLLLAVAAAHEANQDVRRLSLRGAGTVPAETPETLTESPQTTSETSEIHKESNWLSRLGGGGIALVVISISTVPACVFAAYKRMLQNGDAFDFLLPFGNKADEGSESESDA